MREKFLLFVADVTRYGSVASLTLATLLCVPSLEAFFDASLSATAMLLRFLVAFGIATLGVRLGSRTLLRYARQNLIDGEIDLAEPGAAAESEAA